ncbi:Na+/H+ antiporter NhaC family protein [Galactobacillus timonensis]|uniref:Na+/H+ antiporter NhaC family protein n=1 Tax=Galactobacillus timonensis TaxID=2041840 RepID=UPI00108362F6|nr:Na+/H+ antiporter NhaC family protein [Galactobacillus timonensis]
MRLLFDYTAAPVCMLAPISSWAAAVSTSLPDGSKIDGIQLFFKTIPYNFYTWFSLAMIFFTTLLATDFGKMRKYEKACESGNYKYEEIEETKIESNNTGKSN